MLRESAVSAVGAVAAVLVLGAPASAYTWTATHPGPFTTVSGSFALQDYTAGLTITCTGASAAGTVHTVSTGTRPIVLTALSMTGCSFLIGTSSVSITLTANISSTDPWSFVPLGPTDDDTPGSVEGVSFHASTLGGLCAFDADGPSGAGSHTGRVDSRYANGAGQLLMALDTDLRLVNASNGCRLTPFKNNDAFTMVASFLLSGSGGAVPTITVF